MTFTNGADSLILPTPSLVGVKLAPFANNVAVSGSSLDPTFTWSYPSSVNGVIVLIYDKPAKTARCCSVNETVWRLSRSEHRDDKP